MPLKLAHASVSDAPHIADIHMSAFGNNEMLLAQFPTPTVRSGLRTSLARKAIAEIKDDKWEVLVVRDEDGDEDDRDDTSSGKIISFAKWCRPVAEGDEDVEEPWVWPKGTDMQILDEWTRRVEEAEKIVLGSRPCYRKRVSF